MKVDSLDKQADRSDTSVNFITKYSPLSGEVQKILRKHSNVSATVPGLSDKMIRCVWQRDRNLKDLLSPAIIPSSANRSNH